MTSRPLPERALLVAALRSADLHFQRWASAADWSTDVGRGLTRWRIDARLIPDGDEDDPVTAVVGAEGAGLGDPEPDGTLTILSMTGYTVRPATVSSVFDALDSIDSATAEYLALIDPSSDDWSDDLVEVVDDAEMASLAHIVHSVRVAPLWRGLAPTPELPGAGSFLVERALELLSGEGFALLALKPWPVDTPREDGAEPDPVALAQVERVWGRLGFLPFSGGLWVRATWHRAPDNITEFFDA
ncbi:hypothetical protein OMK64_01655 [Cellulomonas fimi]|uniref:hypothetical protein n=1 Tax=Cellulomonas fimi TaxID=1708 RepID=UPI00234D0C4C|nr:hypothetical protein [Cellulomonas fimi]MDC7120237.1 hypothetical protein [Cellulomonas fimi]